MRVVLTFNIAQEGIAMSRAPSDVQVIVNIGSPFVVPTGGPGRIPSTPASPGLQASKTAPPDAAPAVAS